MNALTCRNNRLPMPSKELAPGDWLRATARHIINYEPCGRPATHVSYEGRKPLCDAHAEELRAALRSPDSLGNVLAGRVRTEEEIAAMVRPLV